ncbi:MAG: hypothetical protein K8U03_07485 [Planctomycetia bacterium]|nr:hypothetical protein [Planctomycetia bacterium]
MMELMVVILILLSVTAVSIPLVTPALSGRQVREGARMVSTFFNAARNRAIETGRPAGVWIERMPSMREAASTMYYAEIPPLYSGDFLDSQVELFNVNGTPNGDVISGALFKGESTDPTCKDCWNIVVPRGRTTFNSDAWASPDPKDQQIVRPGDLIQIEGSDLRIPLKSVRINFGSTSVSTQTTHLWWYLYRGRNCNAGPDGTYSDERRIGGEWVINWFDRAYSVGRDVVRSTTNFPMNPGVTGLKYKIYRQPVKLQAGSVKLPEGIVIDLGFSAITNGTTTDPGIPFHPRSEIASPYYGAEAVPQDETPVILVFSPGGHVERLYFRMKENNAGTTNLQWVWGGNEPFGQIHFLIGKLEKILKDEYFSSGYTATDNFNIQVKKNWLDLENIWVNVNPQTGFISTSLIDELNTNAYFLSTDKTVGASNPANIAATRSNARYGRVIGGN